MKPIISDEFYRVRTLTGLYSYNGKNTRLGLCAYNDYLFKVPAKVRISLYKTPVKGSKIVYLMMSSKIVYSTIRHRVAWKSHRRGPTRYLNIIDGQILLQYLYLSDKWTPFYLLIEPLEG